MLHRWQHRERYKLLASLLHNQTLGKSQLIEKQKHALTSIVQFAYNNTSFYQEKYRQVIGDIANEHFPATLPVLDKNEVVQHRDEMLAWNIDKTKLSLGNTGGSTGKPVSFYYDQHKHELMRAGMMRSYMWSGWQPGQKILNFWGARQDLPHSNPLVKKYQDYISSEITLPAHEYTEVQLNEWANKILAYRPVLLQGYASILAELSKFIINNNIRMPDNILGIYSTAEVLYDEQRKKMEKAFGCKVFNQYGSREIPNIACECRYGNMHIFTDMNYLESQLVNNENRLHVTSLTNRVMPMIRYDIGDSGSLKEGDCKCGSPFPMMQMGLCRSNDLIKTSRGKTIHPSFFNSLLYGLTEINQYQFVQNDPGKITLNLVAPMKLSEQKLSALQEKIRRGTDKNMILEVNYLAVLKKSISGKHRFVISKL